MSMTPPASSELRSLESGNESRVEDSVRCETGASNFRVPMSQAHYPGGGHASAYQQQQQQQQQQQPGTRYYPGYSATGSGVDFVSPAPPASAKSHAQEAGPEHTPLVYPAEGMTDAHEPKHASEADRRRASFRDLLTPSSPFSPEHMADLGRLSAGHPSSAMGAGGPSTGMSPDRWYPMCTINPAGPVPVAVSLHEGAHGHLAGPAGTSAPGPGVHYPPRQQEQQQQQQVHYQHAANGHMPHWLDASASREPSQQHAPSQHQPQQQQQQQQQQHHQHHHQHQHHHHHHQQQQHHHAEAANKELSPLLHARSGSFEFEQAPAGDGGQFHLEAGHRLTVSTLGGAPETVADTPAEEGPEMGGAQLHPIPKASISANGALPASPTGRDSMGSCPSEPQQRYAASRHHFSQPCSMYPPDHGGHYDQQEHMRQPLQHFLSGEQQQQQQQRQQQQDRDPKQPPTGDSAPFPKMMEPGAPSAVVAPGDGGDTSSSACATQAGTYAHGPDVSMPSANSQNQQRVYQQPVYQHQHQPQHHEPEIRL
ncbi:hypothetical protein H696_05028 [Fonticula alba]|uniref:Uncharacterized protein n=1 Tax=Fonticula alba TaxID=691883 RepID=A0A058Z5D1_FONAL|nr:hypothetical protein H696_05028 [Fonticula alba]KCV68742.1 hypothetical protein H696_05028 [Fonticula alba]|eukprot:XP_009497174.1 hypothetical protein H696_05028 [Fonticula alba]